MSILDQSKIDKRKYIAKNYQKKERFINYWTQIDKTLSFNPESVLEVGVGAKTVYSVLKGLVPKVLGLDINSSLNPDIIGSVESIPVPKESFDVVLAAEVLEHLPFESFEKCLSEIYRVSKKGAVISIPHRGATFSLSLKIPALPWIQKVFKIPYFWKTKMLSPEHFWEAGLKNYSVSKIKHVINNVGFKIRESFICYDDVYHLFFIIEKQ